MARIRVSRVGEQVKKELSQIIQQEIKDPRIGFVTVTAVEMSGDLQVAKVYISVMGSADQKSQTLSGLEKAKGYIRSEVGRRIKLRHVPELVFVIDNSLDRGEHISRLLTEVNTQEKE
ncbi:30S ribosome-binding factor RbfA [Laceyella sacchari]|jgi:ribosome-binding factor A|uniref:Ribosome-binding factor A n=2 Tax=Laceyella TaxID=292635 RepID=A0AA45WSG2_9BACL|nr:MULTISPECIES: 30S ribosome-binding factor RbfA [Laceyella]AUS09129.1 30S ribosome-binding factor RbfA [Laceyella sacchari]PRZ11850.1 ribosome-binding factor A [Laceyella sediminis]SMP35683.1 ribosome-binding factor A [Laceyella tengchongensis]